MVWSLLVIALVSAAQLTYGREIIPTEHESLMVRNFLPRSDSSELEDENLVSSSNSLLYNMRENGFRSPFEEEGAMLSEQETSYPSLLQKREPFVFLSYQQPPSSSEQIQTEADLMDLQNLARESNLNEDNLNSQERFLLQKRLKMKGMGLLGSSNRARGLLGSPKGLLGSRNGLLGSSAGFSGKGRRPKALVLSIDLGIKALRDAILHAKVQQKHKYHRQQAQKNMHLLHAIGKRDSHLKTMSEKFEKHLN